MFNSLSLHVLQVFVLPGNECLRNYTVFEHTKKKMTCSDMDNWGPVVTIKHREKFAWKVANVAPARACATLPTVLKTIWCSQKV